MEEEEGGGDKKDEAFQDYKLNIPGVKGCY